MGVFRAIPLINTGIPYLSQVDFDKLATNLEDAQKAMTTYSLHAATASELTMTQEQLIARQLIRQYPNIVGLQPMIEKLRQDLGPSGNNSVLITGPRESGKTSLMEAIIRLRAQGRLSSQMGTKPFFILDPTAFFTETEPSKLKSSFANCLQRIGDQRGFLLIDHIDDFVEIADRNATLLMNMLVTKLEQTPGMQAVVISEDTTVQKVYEAASSVERRFRKFSITKQPGFDELKPMLMAQALRLSVIHNLIFSEEAVDEIIRVLSRFPGRAFTESRPGNAIQFADMVGSHVRRLLYAEPPELTSMREELAVLEGEYAIVQYGNDATRISALGTKIDDLTTKMDKVSGEWSEKSRPLFDAQAGLAEIDAMINNLRAIQPRTGEEESAMQALEQKSGRSEGEETRLQELKKKRKRTTAEDQQLNVLEPGQTAARQAVIIAEQNLYPELPTVRAEHVRAVFNSEAGISVRSRAETRARLQCLPTYLNSQIFGQDAAKEALAAAYIARENGYKDPSKPTVLLFAGGSGLGKTELVKALFRYHLGLENRPDVAEQARPTIVSLSEYSSESSSGKIVGADPGLVGYGQDIPWQEEICNDPRTILLLDEGDKAHEKVFLTLMQAFDEGVLTRSDGKKIPLKDLIIIVNINGITADDIPPEHKNDRDYIFKAICRVKSSSGNPLFTPAIVNRFNGGVHIFDPIEPDNLARILAQKEMRKLGDDFRDSNVSIEMDLATAEAIVKAFPDRESGGRGPAKIANNMIRPQIAGYVEDRDNRADAGMTESVLGGKLKAEFNNGAISVVPMAEVPEGTIVENMKPTAQPV